MGWLLKTWNSIVDFFSELIKKEEPIEPSTSAENSDFGAKVDWNEEETTYDVVVGDSGIGGKDKNGGEGSGGNDDDRGGDDNDKTDINSDGNDMEINEGGEEGDTRTEAEIILLSTQKDELKEEITEKLEELLGPAWDDNALKLDLGLSPFELYLEKKRMTEEREELIEVLTDEGWEQLENGFDIYLEVEIEETKRDFFGSRIFVDFEEMMDLFDSVADGLGMENTIWDEEEKIKEDKNKPINVPTLTDEEVFLLIDMAINEALLSKIEAEIGESPDGLKRVETGGLNDTYYAKALGYSRGKWCGYFVINCLETVLPGIYDFAAKRSAYKLYKYNSADKIQSSEGGYQPYSGDVFFYLDSDVSQPHQGIVLGSDENYMYTVEGNLGGMVKLRKRSYNDQDGLYFVMNNSGDNMLIDLSEYEFSSDDDSVE